MDPRKKDEPSLSFSVSPVSQLIQLKNRRLRWYWAGATNKDELTEALLHLLLDNSRRIRRK
ncbi:unnamed protein product [Prunus armeniaca]